MLSGEVRYDVTRHEPATFAKSGGEFWHSHSFISQDNRQLQIPGYLMAF